MDFEMLERDLTTAIKRLPQPFVKSIATLLVDNKDRLVQVFPAIANDLGSHVKTIMFEAAMGSLDKDEIEECLKTTLVNLGAISG